MALPAGAVAIASLVVGDQVLAYDPQTGHPKAEPVEHVFINHDTNLLDVTLAPFTTTTTPATQDDAISPKEAHAALASHGTRAPPTSTETLHTTTEHPFLITDRGFVDAAKLQVGEQVQQLDGRVGVVGAVVVTPGAAVRYNLTVHELHTFAVGAGLWGVHNDLGCGIHSSVSYDRSKLGDTPSSSITLQGISNEPVCHWCQINLSTVADHEPALVQRWKAGEFDNLTGPQAKAATDNPLCMVGSCRSYNSSKSGREVGTPV